MIPLPSVHAVRPRMIALLVGMGMFVGGGRATGQSITATATRPVVPLLVGEDRLPLCRVVVRVDGEEPGLRLSSLSVSLGGTDRVGDLTGLWVVGTGVDETLAAIGSGERRCPDVAPSGTLTIPVDTGLVAGINVLWIVGRLDAGVDPVHRLAVTCTALETSAGKIVVEDGSAGVRQRVGIALRRQGDDGVHTTRIPVLAVTPKGTLLAAYDLRHRGTRDLQEDIDVGLSRSVDGGKTWEPLRTIMDMGEAGGLPQEQNGCGDPGILVDDVTGRVFCFALWVHGKPGKHQWHDDGSEPGFEIGKTAQFMMVHSDDDGVTWSEPENLTRSLKEESWWLLAPAPQAGFTLADGTLVMPIQGRFGNGRLDSFATIMTSVDRGATWSLGVFGYRGGNECQAAELSDGRIMLNVRSDKQRFRGVVVSSDLGRTWSPHPTSDTVLEEPNCNGSLLSFPRSAGHPLLLFANPLSQKERSHQTIRVSFDDGLTWPEEWRILLDEGRGRGYPSLARVGPDRVGIVYEGSQADVVFQVIPAADLVATP